jgi:ligand-binding SRPBCC domain-containing protein
MRRTPKASAKVIMPTFKNKFTVNAPLAAVAAFHSRTDILKKLTPPPLFVQVHNFGEMQEGMIAEFTMWFGPVPVRWIAKHVDVSGHGFSDVQQQGPLKTWAHTHHFSADGPNLTTVSDSIEYTHPDGWRGLLTRLMFGKPNLKFLFFYRMLVTRYYVKKQV